MRAIVTVMGKDRAGIIAKVSGCLYKHGVNVLDINQTIMQDIFTMIMLVDLGDEAKNSDTLVKELEELGRQICVDIRLQNEEIFNSMHRI